jgi:urate oxidase
MKFKKILPIFLIAVALSGCTGEKIHNVKIIRVTDSRYSSLSDEEFNLVLEKTKEVMKLSFNLKIEYIHFLC